VSDLERVLGELRQLECELLERRLHRRSAGLERVAEAVGRLDEVGSPGAVIARGPEALGRCAGLDRVLVSRLEGGRLVPLALWVRDQEEAAAVLRTLEAMPIPVGYPLVEAEVAQRHDAAIVAVAGRRASAELARAFGWTAYVVAAIALDRETMGLVHADRRLGGLDEVDVELTSLFANGLAGAFERAVLREHVRLQRAQLQSAGEWIGGRLARLSAEAAPASAAASPDGAEDLARILTPRELDVLRLMARGQSNRAIASALVLGEGTVKYHVKNILRKLHARSRSHAVSHYMRLQGEGSG
jgi:DNA-binding CsgD family transcriptional regulator